MIGLEPGQVFVHANLANMASAQDADFLSARAFAIDVPGDRHVMVVDRWLQPLRGPGWRNGGALDALLAKSRTGSRRARPAAVGGGQ